MEDDRLSLTVNHYNTMADPTQDPISLNVQGVQSLVGSKINKLNRGAGQDNEGIAGDKVDVLSLDMSDEELLKLADAWSADYALYYGKLKPKQDKNLAYYLGRQMEGSSYATDGTPIAANLIFEAEETYLAAALSKNPDPVVYSDNTTIGNKIADDVKTMLQYHADVLCLRAKLKLMARQHSIYYLGVFKHGWDDDIKEIKTEIRKIQDFVLDPEGYVDVYGDFVGYLGEKITLSAERLADMFPEHKTYIELEVEGKMGTPVTYTEWWTDEFCFYTFKSRVLGKHKNEFFNYPEGNEEQTTQPAIPVNHFAKPKKPFTFLSVFSLEEQPHDITGLIEQNIPNQNLVSRETNQIDYNISRTNHSTAFSENNFNQQTAKQAAVGWRQGHPILVPPGVPISEAIKDFPPIPLPPGFFTNLENNMANLRSIFGVTGITAQKPDEDTTARGMILNQQYDNSRIGGSIGEAIEQVADNVFNWWVQLYYVFYDDQHFGAVMGTLKSTEYVTFTRANLTRKIVVSVAPDSMKGRDEITQMNQALQLWQEGALDPQTLLTILNFPNPKETAAQVVLWKINPQLYMQMNFPDIAQLVASLQMQAQQAAMGAPVAPQVGGAAPIQGTPPPTTGGVPATASLGAVPLPK